jgi:hypothetical protein
MQRRLVLPALAACLACLVVGGACSKFEPADDANTDAAVAVDAMGSTTDGGADDVSNGEASTGDSGLLLGSMEIVAPKTDDSVSAGSLDTHGFLAASAGTARFMVLYVREWPDGGTALVGVYSDASGVPAKLLAQGTVANPARTEGWASAQLNPELKIVAGTTYWLGYYAPTPQLVVRTRIDDACPSQLNYMNAGAGLSTLPTSFLLSSAFKSCEPAVYLTP